MLTLKTPIARDRLHSIPVPVREDVSSKWRGTNHGEFADLLIRTTAEAGLKVKSESWQVAGPQDADLFFDLVFEVGKDTPRAPGDLAFTLSGRHGNSGRYAYRFYGGLTVFVCGNGALASPISEDETPLRKLHTTGNSVPQIVRAAVSTFLQQRGHLEREVKALQAIDLSTSGGGRLVEHAIVEVGRRDLLPWSDLGKVDREYATPRHEGFRPRDGWSLYNAFTEVAKESTPARQLKLVAGLRDVILGSAILN